MIKVQANDIFLEVEPPITGGELVKLAWENRADMCDPMAYQWKVCGAKKPDKKGRIETFSYTEDEELDLDRFQRFYLLPSGGATVA